MTLARSSILLVLATACGGPPPVPTVGLGPASPTTADPLTLTITDSAELDSDEVIDYDIVWFLDDESVDDLAGALEVPADRTAKAQTWRVEVFAFDDKDRSSEVVDASVTVINSAPTATVSLAPTDPSTTDDLVATVEGLDLDGDALTWTWTWTRDGQTTPFDGDTIDAADTARDEVWAVTVVPNDGEVDGDGATASVTIVNSAPTTPGVALTPGDANDLVDLVCEVDPISTDVDGDAVSYAFDWTVDGTAWNGDTATTTHAGDTVLAANTLAGEVWSCAVTADDGDLSSATATSSDVTIQASWSAPEVGLTGSFGVSDGADWQVCRADEASAWFSSGSGGGTYRIDDICKELGYDEADAWGGNCDTVCGYCGTVGEEYFDNSTGCSPPETHCSTVTWRCVRAE